MKKTLIQVFLGFLLTAGCGAQPVIGIQPFASGLSSPVDIRSCGDGRLYVVEQEGYIVILDSNGIRLSRPFLDIHGRVNHTGNEQGLLGMAFHPNYAGTGFFYVNYTGAGDSTHISRFTVSGSDPDSADPNSEFRILTIYQPYQNHNGGQLQFGPDGYLYIGLGDGGSAGDPENRAQDLAQLLGKILRIDVNGGSPYAIPPGNPFAGQPPAREEIWAFGLRNPWRFSFDRVTGDLWIADVGQAAFEEIDLQPAGSAGGENYGWRCYEGFDPYNLTGCPPSQDLVFPVYAYPHDATPCWSVTGGYVYRGSTWPGFQGDYFFADYCKDSIWALSNISGNWQIAARACFPGNNFSTFGENDSGELFIAGHSSGKIYKVIDAGSSGTGDKSPEAQIRAEPNPFSSHLKITLPNGGWRGMVVILRDISGRICYSINATAKEMHLDTGSLAPGSYLLEVYSPVADDRSTVIRLIKIP